MNAETEATLSILIAEINDILDDGSPEEARIGRLRDLLESWVSANNLRVHEVKVMSREEFARRFGHRIEHLN